MDKFQTTVFSCWGFCSRGCSCSCCCCTVGRGLILSTLDIWQVLREAEPFAMFVLRCALPTTNVTPSPWSTSVWKTTKIFFIKVIVFKGGLMSGSEAPRWISTFPWFRKKIWGFLNCLRCGDFTPYPLPNQVPLCSNPYSLALQNGNPLPLLW